MYGVDEVDTRVARRADQPGTNLQIHSSGTGHGSGTADIGRRPANDVHCDGQIRASVIGHVKVIPPNIQNY